MKEWFDYLKIEILDRIEESWLDKLIKLLTEHCRKHYWFKDNDDIEIDHDSVQFHLYHNAKRCFPIGVEKVISKEFWFIKYLVDNNKIDFTKDNIEEFWYYWTEWHCDKYDNILMNLSIQDSPIEFLISILK